MAETKDAKVVKGAGVSADVSKGTLSVPGDKTGAILKLMFAADEGRAKSLFKDSIPESTKAIIEAGKKSTTFHDGYTNQLTATGDADKVKSFEKYTMSNDTLNWGLWLALYQDSWVFKRAIDKPATDMVRPGITLQLEHQNKDDVERILKGARTKLIELIQWGRLFGGSVAVVMFDKLADEDYSKPMEKSIIKVRASETLKLYVTDRWYGLQPLTETVIDMKSLDFGKPKSYKVTFADGKTLDVDASYVLRYEGRVAPPLIKRGMLQGWGYAEGAHIINELSRDDQLKSSITSLINKALIEVIKMDGMRGIFQGEDEESQQQIEKRLEMVNWGRNFNALTFLDKEDEYQEHGFGGLGGLSDLLENNMWLISAALEMQGVLFGDLKTGFQGDGEALERYDETILNLNESYFREPLTKFISILYKKYEIDAKVEFEFNSLLVGKHEKERMAQIKQVQELLSGLLGDGAITAKKYAEVMSDFITTGKLNLKFNDEELKEIEENEKVSMEGINLEDK